MEVLMGLEYCGNGQTTESCRMVSVVSDEQLFTLERTKGLSV